MSTSLVAVIPASNEEKTIRRVLEATKACVDKIIVIDDGSKDDTYKYATETADIVIKNTTNEGYGAALRKGFEKAIEVGADFVVTLDADGEHNPLEIKKLLNAIYSKNADIAVGTRFSRKGRAIRMPVLKRISNILSTVLIAVLYRVRLTDSQSGFRIYRRHVLEPTNWLENGMLFNTEILIDSLKRNLKLVEVSIISVSSGRWIGHHSFSEIFEYPLFLIRNFKKKK